VAAAVSIGLAAAGATVVPSAGADVEPNDGITQVEGPMIGGTGYDGAIGTGNDPDWFYFYAASQSQLTISFNRRAGEECTPSLALRDTDGSSIDSVGRYSDAPSIKYTTAVGTTRYLLAVSGCAAGTYRIQLDPATAIVPGPAPAPTAPTAEPNEFRTQTGAPLAGGLSYAGAIETQNDVDWYTFFTAGPSPIDVALTGVAEGASCWDAISAKLDDGDELSESRSADADETAHFRFTAPAARQHWVQVTGCEGSHYRLQIDPASALAAGPPAPAPVVQQPAPVVRPQPSRRCRTARVGKVRWTRAVAKTKRQLKRARSRPAKRQLKRKLAAQRRTLRRAQDRVTIYCR